MLSIILLQEDTVQNLTFASLEKLFIQTSQKQYEPSKTLLTNLNV